jgi:hypothetical protein
MTNNVCLVIFFNHRFEANIPKLYEYYEDNFENIRIIIPFYDTDDDDRVITVYGNSYNFQGFFPQAYPKLKVDEFSHYIFLGDDCILNNSLNQDNILNSLKQDQESSFITEIQTLASRSLNWLNFSEQKMGFRTPGVNSKSEIPDPTVVWELFKRHGNFASTEFSSFINYKILSWPGSLIFRLYRKACRVLTNNKRYQVSQKYFPKTIKQLPYPLLMGYSDFFVINAHDFQYFCHLCGVFASMRMFAEIAIPTALAIANSHIVQAEDIEFTIKTFFGRARSTELDILINDCQGTVNNLFSGDRKKLLFIHPIKLSSWKVE